MIDVTRTRVSMSPDVLFREVGGEAVLLDLKSERYLGLDEVGTRMWSILTESPSIAAAREALLTEFEVDADRLSEDLSAFVTQLADQGLVTVTTSATPHE